MTATLDPYPPAGTELEAVDISQLLEVLRRLTNWKILGSMAATLSTASTSFTSLGGTSTLSFTKVGGATDTNILAFYGASAFKTTTVTTAVWAISDGTTDWPTHLFAYNTASEHLSNGIGAATMTGLAAGTYTLQARGRCQASVTGALTVNAGDNISVWAMEVPV